MSGEMGSKKPAKPQPSFGVPDPHPSILNPQDVLLGRGIGPNGHPGNVAFRRIILAYRDEYMGTRNRPLKDKIARKVIRTVVENGGRFVRSAQEHNGDNGTSLDHQQQHFVTVLTDDAILLDKTKQALRYHSRKKKAATRTDPRATAEPSPSRRSSSVPDPTCSAESSPVPLGRGRLRQQQDDELSESESSSSLAESETSGVGNQLQDASAVTMDGSSFAQGGSSSTMVTNISSVPPSVAATTGRLYTRNTIYPPVAAPVAYLPPFAGGTLVGNPTQSLPFFSSLQQGQHQGLLGVPAALPTGLTAGVDPSSSLQQLLSATAREQRLRQLQHLDNALLASNLMRATQPQIPLVVDHPFSPPLLSDAARVTAGTYVSPGVGVLSRPLGVSALGNGMSVLAPAGSAHVAPLQGQLLFVQPVAGVGPLLPSLPLVHLPTPVDGPLRSDLGGSNVLPEGSGEGGDSHQLPSPYRRDPSGSPALAETIQRRSSLHPQTAGSPLWSSSSNDLRNESEDSRAILPEAVRSASDSTASGAEED